MATRPQIYLACVSNNAEVIIVDVHRTRKFEDLGCSCGHECRNLGDSTSCCRSCSHDPQDDVRTDNIHDLLRCLLQLPWRQARQQGIGQAAPQSAGRDGHDLLDNVLGDGFMWNNTKHGSNLIPHVGQESTREMPDNLNDSHSCGMTDHGSGAEERSRSPKKGLRQPGEVEEVQRRTCSHQQQ